MGQDRKGTTIWPSLKVNQALDKLKKHPSQSYDAVLCDLLSQKKLSYEILKAAAGAVIGVWAGTTVAAIILFLFFEEYFSFYSIFFGFILALVVVLVIVVSVKLWLRRRAKNGS